MDRECVARVCEHDAGQGKARQAQEGKKVGSMIIRMGWTDEDVFALCRCLEGGGVVVDGVRACVSL
jgi:hypothetical protein